MIVNKIIRGETASKCGPYLPVRKPVKSSCQTGGLQDYRKDRRIRGQYQIIIGVFALRTKGGKRHSVSSVVPSVQQNTLTERQSGQQDTENAARRLPNFPICPFVP